MTARFRVKNARQPSPYKCAVIDRAYSWDHPEFHDIRICEIRKYFRSGLFVFWLPVTSAAIDVLLNEIAKRIRHRRLRNAILAAGCYCALTPFALTMCRHGYDGS